ncbi:hypothetical protein SRHO_G00098880, partial [Serrasalmus rhombeus]
MGSGTLQKTTVSELSSSLHLQVQVKTLPCKAKPHINTTQKHRRLLWARAHLRWTDAEWKSVLRSDESTFQIVFGSHGPRVLRAKEEKDYPDCFQCKVQKPASLMGWGCVSAHGVDNLHICEGTINAERYIQVLEQHLLPSKQRLFQGGPAYFSKTMPSHILHVLQQRGFVVKECGSRSEENHFESIFINSCPFQPSISSIS